MVDLELHANAGLTGHQQVIGRGLALHPSHSFPAVQWGMGSSARQHLLSVSLHSHVLLLTLACARGL